MAKSKKTGTAALQTEVTTDEEWREILNRTGLVVVDVYSEWSGPCAAMISTLRKLKMDVGEVLTFAVAQNDAIEDLRRFRGTSEPTWMFLENGKMVKLIFGANCPILRKALQMEVKRVVDGEAPEWTLPPDQRGPEEAVKHAREEAIRAAEFEREAAKIEAERRAVYEEYLDYMMCELSEETVLILYPWVFLDDAGYQKDKEKCPPYFQLIYGILPDRFDVLEQNRVQLDEETLRKMLIESNIEVTDDLIEGLTQDKILAMRLKSRPPPSTWPVPYPCRGAPDAKRCPTRAINDVENFLKFLLEERPIGDDLTEEEALSFIERHTYVVHVGEEEGEEIVYPAVWYPPQARNKVYVYRTLYPAYLDKAHPYEEPKKLFPLCAFKYSANKSKTVVELFSNYQEAIQRFGVFEYDHCTARRLSSVPEDFIEKIKVKSGNEIFLFIVRRMNEEIFLSFAGSEPIFVEESNEKATELMELFFPEGAEDLDLKKYGISGKSEEFDDAGEDMEDMEEENYEDWGHAGFLNYTRF